jgi:RHS repeat-associated protein
MTTMMNTLSRPVRPILDVRQTGARPFGLTYNPDGQLSTITRPNGVTSTNSYDTAGRLSGLTYKNSGGTTIAAYAYGLDAAGNRTSASTNGATDHYTIDPAGRLTGVAYADGTAVTFGYDAAGNRKSMTTGGSTTSYSYDAAEQLTAAGSTTYTYDPAGNRLTAGSSSYTYDGFGNLASATAGATTIAYRTNGSGLRVSATSGSTTTTYAWDAAAALPSLLSDGTNGYLSAGSTLLAETSASANTYPLTDALSSVRGQSDGTGAVTASASYGVYGDVRSSSGPVGSLGYTGALSDASGLVYLNARSLDPGTGTFTSRDPMTPGGPGVTGFNPYAYVGQNPVTLTDPSGRDTGLAGYAGIISSVAMVSTPPLWQVGLAVSAAFILAAVLILMSKRPTDRRLPLGPGTDTDPNVPGCAWCWLGKTGMKLAKGLGLGLILTRLSLLPFGVIADGDDDDKIVPKCLPNPSTPSPSPTPTPTPSPMPWPPAVAPKQPPAVNPAPC